MEKLLENMIEGKLGGGYSSSSIFNNDIIGIKYNGEVLWSKYFVEYTIDSSISPNDPLNAEQALGAYKYLPEIDDYGQESHNYYEDIKIILNDGSIVRDLTTSVCDVERIIVFYNSKTERLDFGGTRINNLISINTSNITDMSYMFQNCYSLTSLEFFKLDVSKVTTMESMFSNCISLKSIDFYNPNNSYTAYNLTSVYNMFNGCTSLETIEIKNFEISSTKTTDMGRLFYNCTSLKSVDLSYWFTNAVTNMSGLFYNCTSLKSVDLAYFINTGCVTNMKSMFYECSSLTTITNLDELETGEVGDMSYMFYNCKKLTSLDLSNFDTSNVTNSKNMLYGVQSSCKIYIGEGFTLTRSATSFSGSFTKK